MRATLGQALVACRLHQRKILLTSALTLLRPSKLAMLNEIVRSLWPAVTAKDPYSFEAKPFVADAIIANPPCLGHVSADSSFPPLGRPRYTLY